MKRPAKPATSPGRDAATSPPATTVVSSSARAARRTRGSRHRLRPEEGDAESALGQHGQPGAPLV